MEQSHQAVKKKKASMVVAILLLLSLLVQVNVQLDLKKTNLNQQASVPQQAQRPHSYQEETLKWLRRSTSTLPYSSNTSDNTCLRKLWKPCETSWLKIKKDDGSTVEAHTNCSSVGDETKSEPQQPGGIRALRGNDRERLQSEGSQRNSQQPGGIRALLDGEQHPLHIGANSSGLYPWQARTGEPPSIAIGEFVDGLHPRLARTGEPPSIAIEVVDEKAGKFCVLTIYSSGWAAVLETLRNTVHDVVCIQEHHKLEEAIGDSQRQLENMDWQICMAPARPTETKGTIGGVLVAGWKHINIRRVAIEWIGAEQEHRAIMVMLTVPGMPAFLLASVYLRVQAGLDEGNLQILASLAATAGSMQTPSMMCGDYNVLPRTLSRSLFVAQACLQVVAPGSATYISCRSCSEIDFYMMDKELVKHIISCASCNETTAPPHRAVVLTLCLTSKLKTNLQLEKPPKLPITRIFGPTRQPTDQLDNVWMQVEAAADHVDGEKTTLPLLQLQAGLDYTWRRFMKVMWSEIQVQTDTWVQSD